MSSWPTVFARPTHGINHVLAYGQSLSTGWEGFPALSVEPRHDSLMLGDSVRPIHETAPRWEPVGGAGFRRLRACVQSNPDGRLLTASNVAAAPAASVLLGETIIEGALNFWRARMIEDAGGMLPRDHRLLGSTCGVGGRSIEALSRGAHPELFQRLRVCARIARDVARVDGRSYGVTALLLLQGEHNNWGIDGATADRAEYRALAERLYADMIVDLAAGIAGQSAPPALFTYQTGGDYATETNAIPQAQLDMALALPTCFLVGPVYPVTNKGGHLDANGYRWLGVQFGKVLHRVLSRGEAWKPLHPWAARHDGRNVTVMFHVPHPPLAWGRPYVEHVAWDVPDRGFLLTDAAGRVPLEAVSLDGATGVRIVAGRPLQGAVTLRYATSVHGGRGSLHDSDPTVSEDRYEYAPNAGHRPTAAITELVGRPYPLMNWCVAFGLDVELVS